MIRTTGRIVLITVSFLASVSAASAQLSTSLSLLADSSEKHLGPQELSGTPRKGKAMRPGTSARPGAAKVDHSSAGVVTVPHWSDTFTYHELQYKYTMVGTNPKNDSRTTVIPTTLIPLRFVFADGSVFDASSDVVDGQTPVQGVISSPIFQNYDYVIGGTDVGNTQFGDAFQRANFWSDVANGRDDYHLLLGMPNVAPVQTINVPAGLFDYITDPATNQVFPVVDINYLDETVRGLMQTLNGSPDSLEIFVTGKVSEFNAWGYHDSLYDGQADRPYIVTAYLPANAVFYGQHAPDIYVLSHELLEFINDPFPFSEPNFVPGWQYAGDTFAQCDSTAQGDLLEIADAFAFQDSAVIPISIGSSTYHVTDAGFLAFFTRTSNSPSINGQYSFFGSATQPTPTCIGHIEINFTTFEVPGARSTSANGINNKGQIVGSYRDALNKAHGFLLDKGQFTSLDFPGASATFAYKINDLAQVVGYYLSHGLPHGFSYQSGRFTAIDFPGSVDTIVLGINSAGDMVGGYDDSQFSTHSFLLRHGAYTSFDSPFGQQSQANAITDQGEIAGINWSSPSGPFTGFLADGSFSAFTMPGSVSTFIFSINAHNDLAGYFFDSNSTDGFVTLYGNTYQIYPKVIGNNDKEQIVGNVFDPTRGRFTGYVANLPTRNGQP